MPEKYDLENRTAQFGQRVIRLCRQIKQDVITTSIISQLVRLATSVGANYMEANGASSRRDFRNKIFLVKKEAKETKHWLLMLLECVPKAQPEILYLLEECQQLILIFGKIASSIHL